VNTGTVLVVSDLAWGSSGGVHLGTGYITQQTINVPAGHTSVDIVWAANASYGTFQWALDGGGNTSVATTSGALTHWNTTRVTVTPGSTQTIVITPVSGTCRMGGAMFYAGAKPVGSGALLAASRPATQPTGCRKSPTPTTGDGWTPLRPTSRT
jgi:hypothetical protein